ncbi:unnamed protein product [Rotaria sp. Silwood1]|nr:unnamed protein product [Rotaria sp. Silwood1]
MDCIKIIKRIGSEEFIGVYHTVIDSIPRVNLARSTDLLQWTWLQELAYRASQPAIAVPADQPQGYIVVWEQEPSNHLKFAFYSTWDNLRAGNAQKTFDAARTLSPCAEGTPNIYGQPTLNRIDVGFHYYDRCIVDRQARGLLLNFNQWTQVHRVFAIDNAILYHGVQGNIGDRDALSNFDGYTFTMIEGQYKPNDFGTWRIFLYDSQTNNADQVNILTDGRSQAFANPTMTLTTMNGHEILLVTLFLPSEQAASGEAGELIYYYKLIVGTAKELEQLYLFVVVTIKNAQTDLILDSNDAGKAYTHIRNGGAYQVWHIINTNDNCINLKSDVTGLFLDSNGNGDVYTLPGNGGAYQRWTFDGLRIINVATGRALDSNYAGNLYTLEPNRGNFQNWIRE